MLLRGLKNSVSSPEFCISAGLGTLFPAREGKRVVRKSFSIRNEKILRKSRNCSHNFTVDDSIVSGFVLDLAKATKPKKVNSVKHSRIINTVHSLMTLFIMSPRNLNSYHYSITQIGGTFSLISAEPFLRIFRNRI